LANVCQACQSTLKVSDASESQFAGLKTTKKSTDKFLRTSASTESGTGAEEAPKGKVHNATASKKDSDKRCQINGLERIIIKSKKTQKQANNEFRQAFINKSSPHMLGLINGWQHGYGCSYRYFD